MEQMKHEKRLIVAALDPYCQRQNPICPLRHLIEAKEGPEQAAPQLAARSGPSQLQSTRDNPWQTFAIP